MGYKVALVGATGNVGREMLNILDERKFPADEVVALASRRSMGVEVSYGDRTLKVKALEHYDFSDVDICLMSAGGADALEWESERSRGGARPRAWLRTKANSIEGGTSEVMLGIVAKRILDLPGA